MDSDETLVREVASGSEAALGTLCTRWGSRLHGFLRRSGAGEDADDLYQEVWLRVARAAPRFDPRRRFSTWMFQIALNLVRDQHRRRAVREKAGDRTPDGVGPEAIAPGLDPTARVDVERLVDVLSPAQREMVLLRYFLDCDEEECARIARCPRGTVKSRLASAVRRMAAAARKGGGAS